MDYQHLPCIGALLLAGVTIVTLMRMLDRQQREHRAQVDRLLLLGRAETLEQFSAVEKRLAAQRVEEQRGMVQEGVVKAAEPRLARKDPGLFSKVWRRPPTIASPE